MSPQRADTLAASVADQFIDAVGFDYAEQIKNEIVKLLLASPAPVAAEEGPMNLLRKCVTGLEAEADGGWSPAAKSHLSKARVALNMLPAPANESPVDKQTTEE